MENRRLSWTAATVLAVAAVAAVAPVASPPGESGPAGAAGASATSAPAWGSPRALAHSFYYGDDLGRHGDATGRWLARAEVSGSTTVVGYQLLRRPDSDDPVRPAVAVSGAGSAWPSRPLAAPGRSGYSWVGVDGRGQVTAVWLVEPRRTVGAAGVVRWARRDSQGRWSVPRRVRGADGRPTAFDTAPSGYAVLSFVSGRSAYAKVLTPAGHWRPRVRVSGPRRGQGVARTTAVVSDRGRVTAAFWSITADSRSGTSGPLQRGGVSARGHRLPVVDLGDLDQTEPWSLVGSPGGDAVVQVGDSRLTYRAVGGHWRWSTRPVTAVAASDSGLSVVSLSPDGAGRQRYSLSTFDPGGGTWSVPRVVAALADDEYADGSPSAVALVRTRSAVVLAFSYRRTDVDPVTYGTRVVTVTDAGRVTGTRDLRACLVDLAAGAEHAALLTTPACQAGGVISVRTR